ncbi:MAG: aldehyde dehydrogenase family protein [Bosea sp.]|nr:aldehyde dehydrogenase family protein [Bosea sp. (in: a-proteobacteria)]MCP4734839.1 aldehyde dehydrogenase family protein [Bosea sp. (in: a-proteobacteria)]
MAGRWRPGAERIAVLDKFSGDTVAEVAQASREEVAEAVRACLAAFEAGPPEPLDRAATLLRAAELIGARRESFITLMVTEAGFTSADAAGEVDRAQVTLRLCAEEATRIIGETVSLAATRGQHERIAFTLRVPIGIVCAITPFNSPLNTVLHKVAPAFAAGNAVILKPSAITPLTAALLCEVLLDAGMPEGFLALLHGSGEETGRWLLEEQAIGFYTFTGSTRVGRAIHAAAGLRRTQLELGSIASTVVCADADLDKALPKIANASFRKAGQVCTSVQRLFVEDRILGEVTERLVELAATLPAGDPRQPQTRVGPMISPAAAERAQGWVEEARLGQARIACGGTRERSVMQPTVLTNVRNGMKVVDQEIFAPVVSVLPFSELGEALRWANDTPYGLAAGIFTRDVGSALGAARKLRFGSVHINETSSSRADAMPFGGVKDSGFGHEGPRYAIRELTEERLITLLP